MKPVVRHTVFATLACILASATTSIAGTIRFNATINAAQETTGSTSTATGTAVMLYNATTNTFDLTVTINDLANVLTLSHIHEGAVGVAGDPVVDFGVAEANYIRTGNSITATFSNMAYTGTPATLITGGTYLNYHTAAWAAGEIRGQLIPEPVKLVAVLTPEQEVAAPPVVSDAYGAAHAIYDPVTNMITTIGCVYNFTNPLSDSHIHEAAAGVNGPVRTGFGGAANYIRTGNTYVQIFADRAWGGSPLSLINGGAYYNVHSNPGYPAGEIRGQFHVLEEGSNDRLVNVSARGFVGTGDAVMITGFVVHGTGPVRVLTTARGPSLADFGVSGALADPVLNVFDVEGRLIMSNDSVDDASFQDLLTDSGLAPTLGSEGAALLILPPGAYTCVIGDATGGTGIALAEASEISW